MSKLPMKIVGMFPKSFITGKSEDEGVLSKQMHIISSTTKTKPAQLWFKDEETAHAYWQEHFGGENKDYDKEEASFVEWCNANNLDFSL